MKSLHLVGLAVGLLLASMQMGHSASVDTPIDTEHLFEAQNRVGAIGGSNASLRDQSFQVAQSTSRRSRGEWARIQRRLNELGFNAGRADGKPGRRTQRAIANFQSRNGLRADGKIGPQTMGLLFSDRASAASRAGSGRQQNGGDGLGNLDYVLLTGELSEGGRPYPVEVEVRRGKWSIDYPSFPCGGSWKLVSRRGGDLAFDERLTRGGGCITRGFVRLKKSGPGTYRMEWSKRRGSRVRGVGRLRIANTEQIRSAQSPSVDEPSPEATAPSAIQEPADSFAEASKGSVSETLKSKGFATYYGSLRCGRKTHRFQLYIEPAGNQKYSAYMYSFYRWSRSGSHRYETLIGEYDRQNNKIALVRDRKQLHGIRWLGSKIMEIKDNASLTFSIADDKCQSGQLRPFAAFRTTNQLRQGAPGTFFQARTFRQKCEALLVWLENSNKLFDPKKPSGGWNLAKLYTDPYFLPVFGVPYDQLTLNMIKQKFQINPKRRNQSCSSEPFVRERWRKFYGMHSEGFTGAEHHKIYIDWYVRTARNISAEIETAIKQADDIYQVKTVKSLIDAEKFDEFVTVDQVSVLRKMLDERKRQKANADNAAFVQQLNALNPRQAIARYHRRDLKKPRFFEWLSGSNKQAWETAVRTKIASSVDTVLAPQLASLKALDSSFDGVAEAKRIQSAAAKLLADADSSKFPAVIAMQAELSSRQSALVETLKSEVRSFAAGPEGLQTGLDWIDTFNRKAQDHLTPNQRSTIEDFWESDRDSRLEAALPKFEQELMDSPSSDVDVVLNRYLMSERDKTSPIALEYELVAELYR